MSGTLASYPGITWRVRRIGPIWPVKIQTSQSGREQRALLSSTPRYKYVLEYEFFDGADLTGFVSFLLAQQGQFGGFTYVDELTSDAMTVRLDTDSPEFEQLLSGVWKVGSLPLISLI